MVLERFRTGLVFVLRLNTIFVCRYRASTRPRLQAFKIRLEDESRVGTPIRRNLYASKQASVCFPLKGSQRKIYCFKTRLCSFPVYFYSFWGDFMFFKSCKWEKKNMHYFLFKLNWNTPTQLKRYFMQLQEINSEHKLGPGKAKTVLPGFLTYPFL